jgi:large subunit ribosomal protein L3
MSENTENNPTENAATEEGSAAEETATPQVVAPGLLGRKVGMTQVFDKDGNLIPVTVLEVAPNVVTQVKTADRDGYTAVQVGYGTKKPQRVNRALRGHLKRTGSDRAYRWLREFRTDNVDDFKPGLELNVEASFKEGDVLDISGTTKGRGFQGVVKRYGFGGGRKTHGSTFHRAPGSIGQHQWPGRVMKNKKLPGHMGDNRVTVRNLKVHRVLSDQQLMLVTGSVPGARNGLVELRLARS